MKIAVNTNNMRLFECLSSPTRIRIIELLGEGAKNISELAQALDMSSAMITRHISILEECDIVQTESIPGKRGLQKVCSLSANEITLTFRRETSGVQIRQVSIPIGQYSAYEVHPTCGLLSTKEYIGVCDDPRYFSSPDRVKASLLWFQTGWVEYKIPSYVIIHKNIKSIEISLEICSEFPNYKEDHPSDIHFYLNDIFLGVWVSPGDFGKKKGVYTPDWWRDGTQYGLLKNIRITKTGTMLDGIHLSDTTLDDIPIEIGKDLVLRIAVPANTKHPGGVNIFGKGFGNYDQDIEVRIEYE